MSSSTIALEPCREAFLQLKEAAMKTFRHHGHSDHTNIDIQINGLITRVSALNQLGSGKELQESLHAIIVLVKELKDFINNHQATQPSVNQTSTEPISTNHLLMIITMRLNTIEKQIKRLETTLINGN